MGWKNLHYWLKFGIALALIDLVFIIMIMLLIGLSNNSPSLSLNQFLSPILIYSQFFIGFFAVYFMGFSYPNGIEQFFNYLIIFLPGIIGWFIIGSLIGFIHQKIKSKKKELLKK